VDSHACPPSLSATAQFQAALSLIAVVGAASIVGMRLPAAEIRLPPLPISAALTTESPTALQSVRVPAELPFGVGLVRVEFDLTWATTERAVPNTFLDSVSLSFQPPGTTDIALLWTADASGSYWFPMQDGNLRFPETHLQYTPIDPPQPTPLGPGSTTTSFAVALSLPVAWQNCEIGIWLDLFHNQDPAPSQGWLENIRLTARDPFFLLESSVTPEGPFSAEMGVIHRPESQEFELPIGGHARFFRLRADSTVRLRMLPQDSESWRFAYEFPEPDPRLESAPQLQGPYTLESTARLDGTTRRFLLTAPAGGNRFFRVRANVRTAITRIQSAGVTTRIEFEYRPRVFSLQSSAQPCGPYADDPSAHFDTARQIISVPRLPRIRIFRIAHSTESEVVHLEPLRIRNRLWVLPYSTFPRPSTADP